VHASAAGIKTLRREVKATCRTLGDGDYIKFLWLRCGPTTLEASSKVRV